MHSRHYIAFSLLLLLSACAGIPNELKTPEADFTRANTVVDNSKKNQPALAILAEQQNGFEADWREQLRKQLVAGTPGSPETISDAIVTGMALFTVGGYLVKADNDRVDAFFQQQRILVAQAQNDPRLCSLLLNTPSARQDSIGEAPWLLKKPYSAQLPALQQSISKLVLDAQGKQPRLLPPAEAERFMQRTASQMGAKFGQQSLKDYEAMLNANAGPAIRCKGLYELMETINLQAPELRAQMVRQFFGD
jgi:hypothetical protein